MLLNVQVSMRENKKTQNLNEALEQHCQLHKHERQKLNNTTYLKA